MREALCTSICGRTILTAIDALAQRLATSPGLPADTEGPVFEEPWQAQAFALAVHLHAAGAFSWSDWARALSACLNAADTRGGVKSASAYYECWLTALEQIVVARGVTGAPALAARKSAWIDAYRRTPHGQPVTL